MGKKILAYSDVHWSQYSSIIRSRSNTFSTRLENCIQSVNWAEQLGKLHQVERVICLGDFFDKSELNAEELSAINCIEWCDCNHYFLVGNHEMGINSLNYSSSHLFQLIPNCIVIDKPRQIYCDDCELFLLPYTLNPDKINYTKERKTIMFSHNDIAGIQMGNFISKTGYSIEEIKRVSDLFINGHLHNGAKICDGVINIGNLTGQNFSEDASVYDHVAFIIDTESLRVDVYENPYAFNFYKLDATSKNISLSNLKSNSVITLKCKEKDVEKYREEISNNKNIIESRLLIDYGTNSNTEYNIEDLTVDHLSRFREYILSNVGNDEIILEELEEVLK